MINSTDEFLNIVKSISPNGLMASLDVESLFTNIPLNETIDIIIDCCYNHPHIRKPKIPKNLLRELLILCTSNAPFRHINGKLFYQKEGIAMGSPLGPTFANFYMGHIENKVLNDLNIKPAVYTRYVDDVFVMVENENKLLELKKKFEDASILKFTYEISKNNKIPFLDVNVQILKNKFVTSVYTKETNDGNLINYDSECPSRYKIGTIVTLLNRALKVSSDWQIFNTEMNRLKQIFINNGFPNEVFDRCVKNFLNKHFSNSNNEKIKNEYNIYYENQMTMNYRLDERILKKIIKDKITCVNRQDKLNLRIYYKNMKINNLVMRNNISVSHSVLKSSHVVYSISCPIEDCVLQKSYYVGQTQNTVSLRLTGHLQNGAIKDHVRNCHHKTLTRKELEENVKIIKKIQCPKRLIIYEALTILDKKPNLNVQEQNFSGVLKLFI